MITWIDVIKATLRGCNGCCELSPPGPTVPHGWEAGMD